MKKNKTPITIKKLLSLTCDSLEDDKAIDIKTIDLKAVSYTHLTLPTILLV